MDRISFNDNAKCYRVWRGGKNAKQVYFSVSEYGSKEAAFAKAVKYESSLPTECRRGRKKPRLEARIDSQSGIVGVCPCRSHVKVAGWRAFWSEQVDGKTRHKMKDFSFATYGDQAFEKAVEYRALMVA